MLRYSTVGLSVHCPRHRPEERRGQKQQQPGDNDRQERRRPEIAERGEETEREHRDRAEQQRPSNGAPLPALPDEEPREREASCEGVDLPYGEPSTHFRGAHER